MLCNILFVVNQEYGMFLLKWDWKTKYSLLWIALFSFAVEKQTYKLNERKAVKFVSYFLKHTVIT